MRRLQRRFDNRQYYLPYEDLHQLHHLSRPMKITSDRIYVHHDHYLETFCSYSRRLKLSLVGLDTDDGRSFRRHFII
ncbi:hypothetical protein YC2023_024508 [Brassica napus]